MDTAYLARDEVWDVTFFDFRSLSFLCCSTPTEECEGCEALVCLLFCYHLHVRVGHFVPPYNAALGVVIQPVVFVCITVHAGVFSCSWDSVFLFLFFRCTVLSYRVRRPPASSVLCV
ncbi:unnamed protein product, partial [Ectocarpus fasciculatus]